MGSHYTGGTPPYDMTAQTAFHTLSNKNSNLGVFGRRMVDQVFSASEQGDGFRNIGLIPAFNFAARVGETSNLGQVVTGEWDSYLINSYANPIAAWGKPLFIRLHHEFNGTWYPAWSIGYNTNTTAKYVAAWQYIVNLFRAQGATNVSWVWCPNAYTDGYGLTDVVAPSYPGDAYVDWTAIDAYRKTPSASSLQTRITAYYDYITQTIAPSKPMFLYETGTTEYTDTGGVTKAQWITEMFNVLPTRFPKIRGLIYFDTNFTDGAWELNSSTASSDAWKAGVANPRYRPNSFAGARKSPIPAP